MRDIDQKLKNNPKIFWDHKYQNQSTGWDIGYISTPIKEYIDQLKLKSQDILIPGCGNSYEGEYLHENHFSNSHLIDISGNAVQNFKTRVPSFPSELIFEEDFFKHNSNYDLIIEQTFFCALPPSMRSEYVKQMHALLKPKGKLVGLLFDTPLNENHPPFGGSLREYQELFAPLFHIMVMERAYNSITPRQGIELFIILKKM